MQDDYPLSEQTPRLLTKEELSQPMEVIHDLFSIGGIVGTRQDLWTILKVMVTGDFAKNLTREERSDLLYFYEQLLKFVEAVWVVYKKEEGKGE